jgi:hypothetical protein
LVLELEQAWDRALALIGRAGEFGRRDEEGGTIYGWYPAKPGEEPGVDYRVAWLRHIVYAPLDDRELGSLERELGRPLPDTLRRFYTECANGVSMLGDDVEIYGFRRGSLLDPFELDVEGSRVPTDATASHVFFGSWGDDNNPLYLDADDDRVHLSGRNSVEPLRTWSGLGEFLVSTLEEHSSCWDENGRRVAPLPVPDEVAEPTPTPRRALSVPADLAERADLIRQALAEAPQNLKVGDAVVRLASPDELGELQVGYGVGPDGDDLGGNDPGDWRASWLVVGRDEDLGDPFFVDLADPSLPVFTAMHGAGTWDPRPVAPSWQHFLAST